MINMNSNKLETQEVNFRAMGTDVVVEIIDSSSSVAEALIEVQNIFARNEKIFSRFRVDSELAKINANLGKEMAVSPEMLEVLGLCLKFHAISEGYFDPRIIENLEKIGYDKDFQKNNLNREQVSVIELKRIEGSLENDLVLDPVEKTALVKKRIDTTGIAKGYTVDAAAKYLIQKGFKNFVVDAGGDMYAAGMNNQQEWRINIEGLADDRLMLKLKDEGIATSGISRKRWTMGEKQFHHLINPKDPENFSFDIKTVTVIEKQTVEADGRAKVLVLMGREEGLAFANKHNLKALFLDYRGNVYLSKNIKENVL